MSPKTISPRWRAALVGLAGLLLVAGPAWAGDETRLRLVPEGVTTSLARVPTGKAVVIRGRIRNASNVPVSAVKIRAALHTRTQRRAAVREAFAGNAWSNEELRSKSRSSVELYQGLPLGLTQLNLGIPPGQGINFAIVFYDPPDNLTSYTLESISAKPDPAWARKPQPPSKYDRFMDGVAVVVSGKGFGTGFFVSKNGLLVTNNHVVGDSKEVWLILKSGISLRGKVLEARPEPDLALIDIAAPSPAWLSLARPDEGGVGAEVVAIGTAAGLSWSVSRGIISGIRDHGQVRYIQTDAAINQGNSGGPLILVDSGRVVGVNTLTLMKFFAEGISFAVSAENVRQAFARRLPAEPEEGPAPSCDVARAQELLNRVGFYLNPDGKFGPQTSAAVRQYQLRNGLGVTGLLDEATCRHLAEHAPGAQPPVQAQAAPERGQEPAQTSQPTRANYDVGLAAYNQCDFKAALREFIPLARGGHPQAQFMLALMYRDGNGVPQDNREAHRWYLQAAENGEPSAQNNLGLQYEDGVGVAKDKTKAAEWYLKAAEQGLATAQMNVARMYISGYGKPFDYAKAAFWLARSAAQGQSKAQFMLGRCYQLGQGVPRNLVQAYMWFVLAADQGYPNSLKHREESAQRMTPAQIEEAQRLAREWKPRKEWP